MCSKILYPCIPNTCKLYPTGLSDLSSFLCKLIADIRVNGALFYRNLKTTCSLRSVFKGKFLMYLILL